MKIMHKYTSHIHAACASDLEVLKVAGGVNHLIRNPAALLRPDIVYRAISGGRKNRGKS